MIEKQAAKIEENRHNIFMYIIVSYQVAKPEMCFKNMTSEEYDFGFAFYVDCITNKEFPSC